MSNTTIGGCPECGSAYSFFFMFQFHAKGCSKPKPPEPEDNSLQAKVNEFLTSALTGGGYDFEDWTAMEIASEMNSSLQGEFEDIPTWVLGPYVSAWKASRVDPYEFDSVHGKNANR